MLNRLFRMKGFQDIFIFKNFENNEIHQSSFIKVTSKTGESKYCYTYLTNIVYETIIVSNYILLST